MRLIQNILCVMVCILPFSSSCFSYNRHNSIARKQIAKLNRIAVSGRPMFGHQDDILYGHGFATTKGSTSFSQSDVKDVCGDYPAVLGLDLGHAEVANKNIDDQYVENIINSAIEHYKRGGFITISWHADNPVTESNVFDVSDTTVVHAILYDEAVNKEFYNRLSKIADIIDMIRDDNGRLIPIIFRPYHEMNHAGFWWSRWWATPDDFKSLWILTYDYLVKTRKLKNLIWAYSPSNVRTEKSFLKTYPGDQYVDVICYEKYQDKGNREEFIQEMQEGIAFVTDFATKHKKIPTVAECGLKSVAEDDWWTKALIPALENAKVSYVLFWRNAGKSSEYYAPYKGHKSESDFKDLYKSKKMSFLSDIQ